MSELESVVRGNAIEVGSFKGLLDRFANERHLLAVQIPRGTRQEEIFVAFYVKKLLRVDDRYIPIPDSNIYNALITNGKIEEQGDWVLPLSFVRIYPVAATRTIFKQRKVFILDPNSHLGTYIQRYIEGGRPVDMRPSQDMK